MRIQCLTSNPVFFLCLLVLFLHLPGDGSSAGDATSGRRIVCLLHGKLVEEYNEAITGIKEGVARFPVKTELLIFARGDQDVADKIEAINPEAVVTVGSSSTKRALQELGHRQIVFTMVLDPQSEFQTSTNVSGVTLDIAPSQFFEKIRLLLPDCKRVGVIYNPAENQEHVSRATREAVGFNLDLVPFPIVSTKEIPDFKNMEIDALWLIADTIVCQSSIVRQLLLQSIRYKKPVIGLSPAYTKAGALFSLSCDYYDVGRQTSELLQTIIHSNRKRRKAIQPPRKVEFDLNLIVAGRLGINIPDEVLSEASRIFGK